MTDLIPYTPEPGSPRAVICDIDGTLAIHQGRGPFEYERCAEDALNEPVAHYLRMIAQPEDTDIILLSGRPETAWDDTQEWLDHYEIPRDALHMRAEGDYRSDVIVKAELFDRHIRDRYDVCVVLDDRDRCVRLWRGLGLACWQVNDGDF